MTVSKGLTILSVLVNLVFHTEPIQFSPRMAASSPSPAPQNQTRASCEPGPGVLASPQSLPPVSSPAPAPSPFAVASPVRVPASAASPAPSRESRAGWSPRAVHVTGWITQSKERLGELIRMSQERGLNAVVMEVKDVNGIVFSKMLMRDGTSRLQLAIDACHAAGLKAIARFCVFKDKEAEEKFPGMRYGRTPGTEKRISPWTDPVSDETVDYNLKLIVELKQMGIDEINLDYVRFPSGQERARVDLPLPVKCRKITEFVRKVREATKGIRLSVDVFGYVAWDENSARVGQRFEDLAPYVDGIYPMLYPDHFARGDLGLKEPSGHPYEVIRRGCEAAMKKSGADRIDIVPWIQCFTLKNDVIRYGPLEILAQIQGARDAGVDGYLVWNPSAKYGEVDAALRRADGASDYRALVKKYIPAKLANRRDDSIDQEDDEGGSDAESSEGKKTEETGGKKPRSAATEASSAPRPSASPTPSLAPSVLAIQPASPMPSPSSIPNVPPASVPRFMTHESAAGKKPVPSGSSAASSEPSPAADAGKIEPASPPPLPSPFASASPDARPGSKSSTAKNVSASQEKTSRSTSKKKASKGTSDQAKRRRASNRTPSAAGGESLDARLYEYSGSRRP